MTNHIFSPPEVSEMDVFRHTYQFSPIYDYLRVCKQYSSGRPSHTRTTAFLDVQHTL